MSVTDTFRRPNNALVRTLRALLDAPTIAEARLVLDREQDLLLTDAAIKLLYQLYLETLQTDPGTELYDGAYLTYHHTLLIDSKLYSTARGWQAAEKIAVRMQKSREEMKHLTRDFLKSLE